MTTIDTVNHIKALNTNLTPITITTDEGDSLKLPTLTYRERLRLAATLLLAVSGHPMSSRNLVADVSTLIHQLREDSDNNLHAEMAEVANIISELKGNGWSENESGQWVDPSGKTHIIDTALPLDLSIEKTAQEQ